MVGGVLLRRHCPVHNIFRRVGISFDLDRRDFPVLSGFHQQLVACKLMSPGFGGQYEYREHRKRPQDYPHPYPASHQTRLFSIRSRENHALSHPLLLRLRTFIIYMADKAKNGVTPSQIHA
ncbi:hypothetical protein D3C75_1119580 [compost metagenome]